MGTPLQVIKAKCQEVFEYVPDDSLLPEIIACAMVAVMHPEFVVPLWFFVLGPPSSGKTESAKALEDYGHTLWYDEITCDSLVSAYVDSNDPTKDFSLLPTWQKKLIVWKDASSISGKSKIELVRLFGILRAAFDGSYAKGSGTRGMISHKAYFGMLLLGTPWFDIFLDKFQQLGSRCLTFRISRLDTTFAEEIALAEKGRTAANTLNAKREDLKNVVQGAINRTESYIKKHPQFPALTKEQGRVVDMLAALLCRIRTAPLDDEMVTETEKPMRVSIQLQTLGHCRAFLDERAAWNEEELDIIRRVVLDSLSTRQRRLITVLYGDETGTTGPHMRLPRDGKVLMQVAQVPENKQEMILKQMVASRLVEINEKTGYYQMTIAVWQAIKITGLLSQKNLPTKAIV